MERIEYRVSFSSWDAYDAFVEASSPEDAIDKVQEAWNEAGCEGTSDVSFKHRDNGTDFDPDLVEPCTIENPSVEA